MTGPRLLPRPTAASAARAARNATNRSLSLNQNNKTLARAATTLAKTKIPASVRPVPKTDSRPDVKTKIPSSVRPVPKTDSRPDVKVLVLDKQDPPVIAISCNSSKEALKDAPNDVNVAQAVSDPASCDTFLDMQSNQDDSGQGDDDGILPQSVNGNKTDPSSVPQTPHSSRPQTPRSVQSSRPQTPRSRPVTPLAACKAMTASQPNTPIKTRPTTPARLAQSPISKQPSRHPSALDEDDLKTEFTAKQRQFQRLKKELDLKQQSLLKLFDNLRTLGERIIGAEGKDAVADTINMQDLTVYNVGDWTADEIAQLCHDASDTDSAIKVIDTFKPLDECTLAEIDSDISKVPSHFAELCIQAFTARQELVDWVKELISREGEEVDYLDRIDRYNAQGIHLCDALSELKTRADEVMNNVSQISRQACQERSTLVMVGESLVREIARLREDLEARAVIVHEMREIRAENETAKILEDTRRELEEERAANRATKDKLSTTECQLRQTRVRVAKIDRQLRESEASIASLTGTVKSLEDQSRQREVQLEARARKLKEMLKTTEMSSSQMAQQRDALQAEVQSLKEQLQQSTGQNKAANDQLKEVKDLKNAIEQLKKDVEKEKQLRKVAEDKLEQSQATIEELKSKVAEHETTRPNPELPTEREIDLWAELQATKDSLRMAEEEVVACRREKNRFLETLTKISESENKVGLQQKLAAELLSKDEIVSKMQIQIRELTKNIRLNEQKVAQYEQYVHDMQAHVRTVANCREAPNGISYQDLQQEIMTLRMNLLEAVHRNEELADAMAQKEQQLEQQDKTSRAQARVIKVREELINMLKNKETEQSRQLAALQLEQERRMKIVDEVNKQIGAKAGEIRELFTTLETKQQQTHRLEKIVLALEEQQRRSQAQRTKQEEKIAALEHELAAAGNRKDRRFIFF